MWLEVGFAIKSLGQCGRIFIEIPGYKCNRLQLLSQNSFEDDDLPVQVKKRMCSHGFRQELRTFQRVVKGGGGGLNHESREINEVFHDSHKFFEGFTFHVKISAVWNNYRTLGTICNDRRAASWWGSRGQSPQKPQKFGISGCQIEDKNRFHDRR